jgi:N-acetylglutamate synthase-like GNAT family acetyltransferase
MIRFQTDYEGVVWEQVAELLWSYGLTDLTADRIQQAFENSYAVVFAKDSQGRIVGCGRAISDGVAQGAIYNIALAKEYHGQGFGREIMRRLVVQMRGMIITLYTHPKTLDWYEKLGFSRSNTAFVRFREHEIDEMLHMKFIDRCEHNAGIFRD